MIIRFLEALLRLLRGPEKVDPIRERGPLCKDAEEAAQLAQLGKRKGP